MFTMWNVCNVVSCCPCSCGYIMYVTTSSTQIYICSHLLIYKLVEVVKIDDIKYPLFKGTAFGEKTLILKWYKPSPAVTHAPASVSTSRTVTAASQPAANPQSAAIKARIEPSKAGSPSVSHESVLDDDGDDLLAVEGNDDVSVTYCTYLQ